MSYQEPRSSSLSLYFAQYAAWVVGSQESVWKSIWPRGLPVYSAPASYCLASTLKPRCSSSSFHRKVEAMPSSQGM